VVEHVPSKLTALSSNSSTINNKKKKKERKKEKALKLGVVAHTYNLNTAERILSLRPAWTILARPRLKKKKKNK
jgi:hypothetical protein